MKLIIAKNLVDVEDLAKVQTPDATDSHKPIGHALLAGLVREGLEQAGYTIECEEHALARNGLRYFGGFQVIAPNAMAEDRRLVVGARNSHDKAFAAALCLGTGMTVCENLCFSSTIKLARRHTTFIMRDLAGVVAEAIGRASDHFLHMGQRINAYQETGLDLATASKLVYRMVKAKALPKSKAIDVIDEWVEPRHPEFRGEHLWNLYNATTEHLKGSDLSLLPDRTAIMQTLLDGVADFAPPQGDIIDV